jgi:hypothetical protein
MCFSPHSNTLQDLIGQVTSQCIVITYMFDTPSQWQSPPIVDTQLMAANAGYSAGLDTPANIGWVR